MIDDELVARPPRARPDARPPRCSAAPPRTRTSIFQGRETVNQYYDAAPAIVQKAMDTLRQADRPRSTSCSTTSAPPTPSASSCMMGSGAEAVHEVVEHLIAKGEKVGLLKVRLYRPFDVEALRRGPARHRQGHRRAGPHQGARRAGRAAVPGRAHRPRRGAVEGCWLSERSARSSAAATACGSKEFTPAMAKAVFDNLKPGRAQEPLHRRHQRRRDPHQPALRSETSPPSPGDVHRAMFYGLGSDGTVGANKNSIKIIGEETRQLRPGLLRLRLQEGRRASPSRHLRFGPKPIRSTYLMHAGRLRGLPQVQLPGEDTTCSPHADAGGHLPAGQPLRPGRGLGPAAARGPAADHRQEAQVLRHRRLRAGRGDRAWAARINTIMQTCFFAISGVLPRGRGHRADQERHQEDLRQARARRSSSMNFAAVDTAAGRT